MLLDARALADGSELRCDLCIVGAGAAGITIARALAGSRLKIVVLEGGDVDFDPDIQDLYAGELRGLADGGALLPLDASRLRQFGGTTNHWGGWCRPLEPQDFEARPWVPGSGWPFAIDTLRPYYERAQRICELGPFTYGEEVWDLLGLRSGLEPGDPITTTFVQIGPATRFAARYGPELVRAANVETYLHAQVVDLALAADERTVTAALARTLDGRGFRVGARAFVLACGGIGNPTLLLNCAGAAALGNRHGLVGRFFQEHPTAVIGQLAIAEPDFPDRYHGLYADALGVQVHAALCLRPEEQARLRTLNGAAFIDRRPAPDDGTRAVSRLLGRLRAHEPLDGTWHDLWLAARDLGRVLDNSVRRLSGRPIRHHYADGPASVVLMLEQSPDPDSRVHLSDERDTLGLRRPVLDWRLGRLERHSMRAFAVTLGATLAVHGIGHLRLDDWLLDDAAPWPALGGHSHHVGTTRMVDDPRLGVVDRDCRVHGTSNLYIAGSSVFPTGGRANPTLTIVALALRLADHLEERI